MTPEEIKALTDAEVNELLGAVSAELERRRTLTTIPAKVDALTREYLTADGITEGESWRQPQGAFDAYPKGWQVVHGGKTWENLTPANVWEPGISGWREQANEGGPAPWVQPTGAHDAYQTGNQVTFEGKTFESLINNNTWSPTAYPAGWKELP